MTRNLSIPTRSSALTHVEQDSPSAPESLSLRGASLFIKTAPYGHPWQGRPLVLIGDIDVAFCMNGLEAETWKEILTRNTELAYALAEPDWTEEEM